jgi:NAD(P)-dependent dehydrogenase (short-subunit alcohol dehydrogenase family)
LSIRLRPIFPFSFAEQVKQVTDTIVERYGQLDIAVNNAGQSLCVAAEKCSDDQWQKMMDINLNGLFYCCREFGRAMLRQGKGSIVNITSIFGLISNVPQPQSAYNTSKAAAIQLTKSLAAEWAKRGVRVNAVSPGYIETDMTRGAVLFLASDAASFFTGSNLIIDGGYTCW